MENERKKAASVGEVGKKNVVKKVQRINQINVFGSLFDIF